MSSPDDLLSITMRHLQGIGKLIPEKSKMILIDQANQYFFSSWSEFSDEHRYSIVRKMNKFLSSSSVRISLLIRMKLQIRDGSFVDKLTASSNEFFRYYIHNVGENIYEKVNHFPQYQAKDKGDKQITQEIDFLFQQFKVDIVENETFTDTETIAVPKSTTQNDDDKNVTDRSNKTLDELKKKCKLDITEAPPAYDDDNFQELLNMLGGKQ